MRRFLLAVGLIASCAIAGVGCSDATGPNAKSLGTFAVTILFDGNAAASGQGDLTFVLPDSNETTLLVTGSFTVTPSALGGTVSRFSDGTFSSGVVRFRVASQSWQFEGGLTNVGRTIIGRHTRTANGVTTSGAWSASKAGGSPPPPP